MAILLTVDQIRNMTPLQWLRFDMNDRYTEFKSACRLEKKAADVVEEVGGGYIAENDHSNAEVWMKARWVDYQDAQAAYHAAKDADRS